MSITLVYPGDTWDDIRERERSNNENDWLMLRFKNEDQAKSITAIMAARGWKEDDRVGIYGAYAMVVFKRLKALAEGV